MQTPVPNTSHEDSPQAGDGPADDPAGPKPDEKPSRDWIRKAHSRRLRANNPEAAAEIYTPEFVPKREADWTPEFDRNAERAPSPAKPSSPPEPDARSNWMLVAAVSSGLVLATAIGVLIWNRDYFDSARRENDAKHEQAAENAAQRSARDIAAAVPEARKTVERFFAATTPEEKTAFVRGGTAMLPAMREYYTKHSDEPPLLRLASNVEFISSNGRDFMQITGRMTGGESFETSVEQTADGPRLDWRCLNAVSEREWTAWLADRPQKPVLLRVIAKLENLYTGGFEDQNQWLCLLIQPPGGGDLVWAYAKRDDPAGALLLRHLSGLATPVKLQARFTFPAPSRDVDAGRTPQVLIHSIEDHGWLDLSPEATASALPLKPENLPR